MDLSCILFPMKTLTITGVIGAMVSCRDVMFYMIYRMNHLCYSLVLEVAMHLGGKDVAPGRKGCFLCNLCIMCWLLKDDWPLQLGTSGLNRKKLWSRAELYINNYVPVIECRFM